MSGSAIKVDAWSARSELRCGDRIQITAVPLRGVQKNGLRRQIASVQWDKCSHLRSRRSHKVALVRIADALGLQDFAREVVVAPPPGMRAPPLPCRSVPPTPRLWRGYQDGGPEQESGETRQNDAYHGLVPAKILRLVVAREEWLVSTVFPGRPFIAARPRSRASSLLVWIWRRIW